MKTWKFLLPALAMVLLLAACNGNAEALRDHGATTNATVTRKIETTALKAKNRYHRLAISFFAQTKEELEKDAHQNDVLKDTSMSMADRIDKWQPGGTGIGTFTSLEIDVTKPTWDGIKEGESVEIVYLPEDPKVVMLKKDL